MKRVMQQLLLLALSAALAVEGLAQETEVVYWGEAVDKEGRLLYREKHITRTVDGRTRESLTLYLDPEGREIATLASDYGKSLAMPTYVFKDFRRNYEEGLRHRGGSYYIYNKGGEQGEKEKPLEDPTNVFSCQGWHYYIVENMDGIERGDTFALRLIFPNKLRTYNFKIEKVSGQGDLLNVRVRFANRLVGFFVPHLDLVYDREERKLIEYRGVSNIFDAKDSLQEVRITYSNDPPAS
jgi:hypothetical protein